MTTAQRRDGGHTDTPDPGPDGGPDAGGPDAIGPDAVGPDAVFTDDAIAALRGAVLVMARRLRHQQPGDGLSATEVAVLGRVFRDGPLTPGQLARAEHVQPPSMTRIVERLTDRGYLRREPHPDDGRQVLISHTESGQAFIDHTRALRTRWLAEHFERLTAEDQRAIVTAVPALSRLAELP